QRWGLGWIGIGRDHSALIASQRCFRTISSLQGVMGEEWCNIRMFKKMLENLSNITIPKFMNTASTLDEAIPNEPTHLAGGGL
ncbi:unnamed protein product, partial [Sphenostylis stenocarpa]